MSMDDLVTGGKKKKGKAKAAVLEEPIEKSVKVYKRLYLFNDTVDLLDNITYTKEQSGDYSYTQGDAIKEALEFLAKKLNVQEAPAGYKKK
tara:strand:- start:4793 stop:5065 length:273 start_codon:yes stop_codon:yes gene_type:complete